MNRTDEVEEIESKVQEQQRHNEFLQGRIDLLKEKLIGSVATDSVAMNVSSFSTSIMPTICTINCLMISIKNYGNG
jgi:hypothetical protein